MGGNEGWKDGRLGGWKKMEINERLGRWKKIEMDGRLVGVEMSR